MPAYSPSPVAFPSWMPKGNQFSELANTYNGIEGDFDKSYGQANQRLQQVSANNLAAGQAQSAAAARSAQSRAMQTGGSVAASFGQGSLNLANFRQNNRMMSDWEGKQAAARQQMMAMKMQAAGQLGQGRLQQAGLMNDFYGNQQRNALQSRGMDMQGNQFNQSLALDKTRVNNQSSQFDANLNWDKDKFGQQMQFNQQDQRLSALQAAMKNSATPMGSWSTSNSGTITRGQDSYNQYTQAQQNRQNIVNQMQQLGSGAFGSVGNRSGSIRY